MTPEQTSKHALQTMASTVRKLWEKCCEHDGIPHDSKFVAFSPDNPYIPVHNRAVAQFMEWQQQYAAGGYVGQTL